MSRLKVITKESLAKENKVLRQRLADINKYAYDAHCGDTAAQHSSLYEITTMSKE